MDGRLGAPTATARAGPGRRRAWPGRRCLAASPATGALLGSGLLGADSGGGFGGSNLVTSGNGGDRSGIEMHYKKMIEEDPCNGLFLRNYAQFLYQVLISSTANLGIQILQRKKQSNKQSHLFRHHFQVKGDYRRAEEYYSRAILADPDDGELLSEYIKFSLSFVCSEHKFHVNGLA